MDKISEQILKRIEEECIEEQDTQLAFYTNCLMDMLRIFHNVERTNMLHYVCMILEPIMNLTVQFYIDSYNKYCDLKKNISDINKNKERMSILNDIEVSLSSIGEACEMIIQSTNGADRTFVQSAPVSAGLLNVSSKICAYYSVMLNDLADLFKQGDEKEYAFCVFPSLAYRSKAQLLFSSREERGKIGIIKIPTKSILDIKYIRVLLCHECFHIVSRSEIRLRKMRAECYLKILLYDLSERFFNNTKLNSEQIDALERFLYKNVIETIHNKFQDRQEEDRMFYSANIQGIYASHLLGLLRDVLNISAKSIYDQIFYYIKVSNYEEYEELYNSARNIRDQIRNTSVNLLAHNAIPLLCNFYMDVFRETFSDLMSVLLLRLKPEEWINAFQYQPVKDNELKERPGLYIRTFLVSSLLTSNDEPEHMAMNDLTKMWEVWKENKNSNNKFEEEIKKMLPGIEQENEYIESTTDNKLEFGIDVMNNLNMMQEFLKYLTACKQGMCEFEQENQAIVKQFKEKYAIGVEKNLLMHVAKREWENENDCKNNKIAKNSCKLEKID